MVPGWVVMGMNNVTAKSLRVSVLYGFSTKIANNRQIEIFCQTRECVYKCT